MRGEGNHILSVAKNSEMGAETGWACKWLAPIPIFHISSVLMAGACVVMVMECLEYHLWVKTHLQELKLARFHFQSICWPPSCGYHFSFIGLVISVGRPTDSDSTLAVILAVGVVSSFLKY